MVPRNAALPAAAGLVLAAACGGTVTRTGESDSASGNRDAVGGETGAAQGEGGGTPGVGGAGAHCGMLDPAGPCGFASAEPAVQAVDLLLVLDASGSMSGERETLDSTLWEGVRNALDLAMTYGSETIHYGLQIFPYAEDPAVPIPYECGDVHRCCEMPDHAEMLVPTVQPEVGVPWILDELRAHAPAGAAAITPALERAFRYFVDGNPPPNGDTRYVLLVTDGAPICNPYAECDADTCTANIEELDGCPPDGPSCCDDLPAACLDDAASVEQIAALRAAGVTTIVMGLPGSERYSAVLQRLAEAGGFVQADGSTGYYDVPASGGVEGLVSPLTEITTLVVQPCHFAVPDEMENPNAVMALVDCEIVPYASADDPEGGWHWDDPGNPKEMVFTGGICDRIRWQGVEEIHVVFGCSHPPFY